MPPFRQRQQPSKNSCTILFPIPLRKPQANQPAPTSTPTGLPTGEGRPCPGPRTAQRCTSTGTTPSRPAPAGSRRRWPARPPPAQPPRPGSAGSPSAPARPRGGGGVAHVLPILAGPRARNEAGGNAAAQPAPKWKWALRSSPPPVQRGGLGTMPSWCFLKKKSQTGLV